LLVPLIGLIVEYEGVTSVVPILNVTDILYYIFRNLKIKNI
jgi:hypothetical protein